MENLPHPGAGKPIVEEVLSPCNPLASLTPTAHETCSRRLADRALAIGVAEERSLLRQLVEVRCLG